MVGLQSRFIAWMSGWLKAIGYGVLGHTVAVNGRVSIWLCAILSAGMMVRDVSKVCCSYNMEEVKCK